MRWPFRRNGGRPAAEPSAAAPASAPAGRRRLSRPSGPWTELPPLQPTANRLEVTAPSRDFVRELVTQRPHRGALEPLGHEVSLDGPAGLAHIATTARPRHPDDEAYEVAWAPAPPTETAGAPAAGWAEPRRPARRPAAAPPRRTRAAQVHTPPTPRSLRAPNVPQPGEAAVPQPAGPTAPTAPTARAAPEPGTPSAPGTAPTARAAPEPGTPSAPGTAPTARAAPEPPAAPAPPTAPAAPAPGTRPTPGDRQTPERRPTVGARNLTAHHGVQKSPDKGTPPADTPNDSDVNTEDASPETPGHLAPRAGADLVAGMAPDAAAPHTEAAPGGVRPPGGGTIEEPAPGREVRGGARGEPQTSGGSPSAPGEGSVGAAVNTRAPDTRAGADSPASPRGRAQLPLAAAPTANRGRQQGAPITGHRPLVPTSSIHHSGDRVERTAEGVPIHRGPEVSARARDLGARAFTEDGEIQLPREAGPVDQEPARSLLAHELVHAQQQRQLGDRLPPEATEEGKQLEAEAVRAERAKRASGSTTWEARRPGGRGEPRPAAASRATADDVIAADTGFTAVNESHWDEAVGFTPPQARATAAPAAPAGTGARPGRAPQRAPQRADQDVADPLEAQGRAGAGEPGEAGQGGDAADPDGDDVDPLIKKLYPQMLDRLRRDLVIERERAGRLIDRR